MKTGRINYVVNDLKKQIDPTGGLLEDRPVKEKPVYRKKNRREAVWVECTHCHEWFWLTGYRQLQICQKCRPAYMQNKIAENYARMKAEGENTEAVERNQEIIRLALEENVPMADLSVAFGIDRKRVHTIVRRACLKKLEELQNVKEQ